jgi:hypothetical protein
MVGKLVMRERRIWRILSYMSMPWNMQSFIIWIMEGMVERETVRREMWC